MPKFNLGAVVTVSAYTVVDADSLEEAIEIAQGRQPVIGGINSSESPDESWIVDEADGDAKDIQLIS